MGIEQRAEKGLTQRKVTIQVGPVNIPFNEDSYVRWTDSLEDRIYKATSVSFLPGVRQQIAKTVKPGNIIIAYANHESHYDGRPLGKVTHQIMDLVNEVLPEEAKYKGFVLPKATSIDTGDQDSMLQKYSEEHIKEKMARDMLYTVDYTREKDQQQYGLSPNMLTFTRKMKGYIKSGHGIAVFPESTVQGGRNMNRGKLDPRIKIYGMQPFEEKTMEVMTRLAMNEGLVPTFVPIGIYGTFRAYSPDTLKTPTTTITRAILPFLPRGLAKVTVGSPIRWAEMVEILNANQMPVNPTSINDFLGRHLAPLVPKPARGIYRNAG
jgi:hypothetical protein